MQALDDDANAVAAWQQYTPQRPDESFGDAGGDNVDTNIGTELSAINEHAPNVDQEVSPVAEPNGRNTNGNATAGAERLIPNESSTPNGVSQPSTELKGPLSNTCDGTCGVHWTFPDDTYFCKDCVDVQLDAGCYNKLKAGTFDVAICNSQHNFIHVPPFDEETWKSSPQDQVVVGGKVMSRAEWLHGIKRDWRIDEESLKAKEQLTKATTKIRRAWLAFRNTRTGTIAEPAM